MKQKYKEVIELMDKMENKAKSDCYEYNKNHFGQAKLSYERLWEALKYTLNSPKGRTNGKR